MSTPVITIFVRHSAKNGKPCKYSGDRRRQRLVDVLLDYGQRVEESVFECTLEAPLPAKMTDRIRTVVDSAEDKVLAYGLCENCSGKVLVIGPVERPRKRSSTSCDMRTPCKPPAGPGWLLRVPENGFPPGLSRKALKGLEFVHSRPVNYSVHEFCPRKVSI